MSSNYDENGDVILSWEPGHFYSPIPDVKYIRSARDRVFVAAWPATLPGIDLRERAQISLFHRVTKQYNPDFFPIDQRPDRRYWSNNPNFCRGEAEFYAALVRDVRPKRIIEVGSGFSSAVALDVDEALGGAMCLTFIEPYPDLLHQLLQPGDDAKVRIIPNIVQEVPTSLFEELEGGDILFIDSTHVLKTDSDVVHEIFRILPSLKSGVIVHFHDIFYPFEYPEDWVMSGRAWNEIYAIRAFLQYNSAYRILFFNSWFAAFCGEDFRALMPEAGGQLGSSLWIQKA